jgi:hypothetical protein
MVVGNDLAHKGPKNRFQGINSASLCGLDGRYDTHFHIIAPIDCLNSSTGFLNRK